MKKIIGILLVCIIVNFSAKAGNYTWTGTTNSNWGTSTNWSPNGVPGSSDSISISTTTNSLILTAKKSVKRLLMYSGVLDLGGDTLTITGNSGLNGGSINNGLFKTQTSGLVFFNGTSFGAEVSAVGQIKLDGSVFNSTAYFEHNSSASGTGAGGNTFNGVTTLKNAGTTTFRTAGTNSDTFNNNAYFISASSAGSSNFQISYGAATYFNGNVEVSSSSTFGISFSGAGNGSSTLASGKTITIGSGGFTGTLLIKNFTQTGSTSQSLSLSGVLNIANSTFNGSFTSSSSSILLSGCNFNNQASFTKTGTANDFSAGGNYFANTTTFMNSSSTTAKIRLAATSGDFFGGDVNLNTSNGLIEVAYFDTTEFQGDVTINNSKVTFNNSSGFVMCTGSTSQEFGGSADYKIGKLIINKTTNGLTMQRAATIDSSLTLTKGIIFTDTINLVTLKAGSSCSGASSESYVEGPLKKIGNTAFDFPVGDDGKFCPIEISSPNQITDSYCAEYKNSPQSKGTSHASSINFLSKNCHWNINRTNGTSNVYLTFKWNEGSKDIFELNSQHLSNWNNNSWNDLGHGTIIGNDTEGSHKTSNLVSNFGSFILSYVLNPIPIITSVIDTSQYLTKVTFNNYSTGVTPYAKYIFLYGDQCWSSGFNGPTDSNLICHDTILDLVESFHYYHDKLNYAVQIRVIDDLIDTIVNININLYKYPTIANHICEYVPNGQFDNFTGCPNFAGDLGRFIPANQASGQLDNWYPPTSASPDFLLNSTCTIPAWATMYWPGSLANCTSPCWLPNGIMGCEPTIGNTAVGLITYSFPWAFDQDFEYIQCQLIEPLTTGQTYNVRFNVTLGDASRWGSQIHASFTNGPFTQYITPAGNSFTGPLNLPIHVNSIAPILNTNGWVTITGTFTATNSEDHITIGNFNSQQNTIFGQNFSASCNWLYTPGGSVNRHSYIWIDDVSVTPGPLVLGSTQIDEVCLDLGSATAYIVSGGFPGITTYLWSTGSTSATIANLSAGVYTCSVSNTGCTSTISVTINKEPCCDGTINVNDNTLLTFTNIRASDLVNFTNLAGYFVGGNTLTLTQTGSLTNAFAINGTFTVDMDFNFASCHIFMGPNARIVVEAGNLLTCVNKVYFHSCGNYMWDGIYLEPGGAEIKGVNLFIEDAKTALNVGRGSNYLLMSSYFNKNWKGIVVEADQDKISNLTNCTIECVDQLFQTGTFTLNPTPNASTIQLIPHVNQRSFVGIELEDVLDNVNISTSYVGLQIGADSWPNNIGGGNPNLSCTSCSPNTFYNLDFGIHATNSDLLILNNDFKGINNVIDPIAEGILLNSQPGTAILANNTNSSVPNNIFIGTDNQGSFNTLYKNTFEDGKRGVLLLNNVNGMINFNTFTRMTGSGVQLRNAINQSMDVIYNTFVDCVRGFFIRNASNLNGNTNLINVESNTYNYSWTFNPGTIPTNSPLPVFAFAHAGTSARAINLSIKNNTIQKAKTGIFLSNYGGKLFNFQVQGNTIGLDNDISKSLYGIRTTNCRYTQIRQNGIAKSAASSGLTPIGISLESALKNDLYENTLYKMGSGIGANISNSPSTLQCNLMDDNETGAYFRNSNLGVQGNPNLPSDNQFVSNNVNDVRSSNSLLQSVWWTRSQSLPWGTTNQNPFNPLPILFNLVTSTTIPAVNCDNPCIGPGCDQNRLLYVVENDTSFQQLSAEDQYQAKLNAFRIIQEDTSIFDMNLSSDSIFKSFYDSMLLENAGVFQYIEHSIHELDTTEARNNNELIVPENEMETYLQIVNQIYLDTWARDNFDLDSASIAILFEIAYLSPEYFGEAVYLARALLDENLDDYPTELSSNRFAMSNTNSEENLLIFPNPSRSGYFTLINRDKEIGNVSIEIFSLSGQLIESRKLPNFEKLLQLNLSQQKAGTYIIKYSNNEKIFRRTIVKLDN